MQVPVNFFEKYDIHPSDRAAFEFFYNQTSKEGLSVQPEFTWDQFDGGIASFNEEPLDDLDELASGLIPNYTKSSSKENGCYPTVPVLEAITEPVIENMDRARGKMAIRAIGIHPTLASPLVYARSIIAGFGRYKDIDVRNQLYITYGAYPTTMRFDFGGGITISPTEVGRTLGSLLLTAPRTDNTATDEPLVLDWMGKTRREFKLRNHDILQEPGNILIVIPSGRRGKRSAATVPPFHHMEYLPDGDLSYIASYDNPTFIMGVSDALLTNKEDPTSIVNVAAHPLPYKIKSAKHLRDALVKSAELVSDQETTYSVERHADHLMRTGKDIVGRMYRRWRGEHDSDSHPTAY